MEKLILVGLGLSVISGCAKRPTAIAPTSVGDTFANYSCDEAREEIFKQRQLLANLSATQDSAATADALGVFFTWIPVGSATGGDKEGAIALSKGMVLALENRLSSC